MAHIRPHPKYGHTDGRGRAVWDDPTRRRWQARYVDPTGIERSRTFEKKSAAENFLVTVERDKLRGEWTDPALARRTFAEFAAASESARLNRQETTRARDKSVMRSLVLPVFGALAVGRIRPSQVRSWLASLEHSGYSPATIRKAFQLLARVLDVAVEDGALAANPTALVRGKKLLPKADPERRFLTAQEIERLADAIDPAYQAMVWLAAASGARFGELAALERKHVNLLKRWVRIEQTLKRTQPPQIGPPKTEASRRTIQLPDWVLPIMADHLTRHAGDALVFPSPTGKLISPTNWRKRIWLPAVRASVGEPCGFHALRHSHASLLIEQGVNIKAVQHRLGHSDVRTTLSVYSHLFSGWDDVAADAIGQAFAHSQTDKRRTNNVVAITPQ